MITKQYISLATTLLFAASTSAQYCPAPLEYEGNYYCSQVNAITYTSVGGSGYYDRVTKMDSNTGLCSSEPYGYSGSLSPLNEEVSIHVRGPLKLLQFAAYTPGEASAKKARRSEHEHVHKHAFAHMRPRARRHAHGIHERAIGDMVTATINGQVVSWTNEYSGPPASPPTSSPTYSPTSSSASGIPEYTYTLSRVPSSPSAPGSASVAPASSSPSYLPFESQPSSTLPADGSSLPSLSSGWGREAYYSSQQSTANGLVFLNHQGGTGSGVFDYAFGASLSYATPDGCSGASSPQILADTTLPSSSEIVIMTDTQCNDQEGECGYYRPGNVAYHGFTGTSKAFFFEFMMPDDGQTTTNIYNPVNMPAIWMLNAQIPRTLQYGNSNCSCWVSGCGEFDIFEVLSPGYDKAKSTVHGNIAGGSSDWFPRPTMESMKVGVVMIDDCIHIKVLDNDTEFSSTLAEDVVQEIVRSTMTQSQGVSLFSLQGAGGG